MENDLLQKLVDKTLTKEDLLQQTKNNYDLIPTVLNGTNSSKAAIRYGCAKVLVDLSEEHPEVIYPYIDDFIALLDSKYRILTWNAIAIIANLVIIDEDRKFDVIFDKYYSFIDDEYMVTVANIVGHSGKIALAKPYLIERITDKLLTVENISTTPHLSEECKRVIAERAIKSFDVFFDKIKQKERVILFVKEYLLSSRKSLGKTATSFLEKWC
ncbi:hypothetical protein MUP51_10710 [Candidatus Bathyarchaeota archaeon]|jgi:hypothetical protein|nr:hypothetical protein [Candidatus Bathyarchaeota archaeon]TFH17864.1 MAG: hypothetical protein E4H04_04305 [Candidatus Bathyarchaeota archaeon]